jgi:hypothetical protein
MERIFSGMNLAVRLLGFSQKKKRRSTPDQLLPFEERVAAWLKVAPSGIITIFSGG